MTSDAYDTSAEQARLRTLCGGHTEASRRLVADELLRLLADGGGGGSAGATAATADTSHDSSEDLAAQVASLEAEVAAAGGEEALAAAAATASAVRRLFNGEDAADTNNPHPSSSSSSHDAASAATTTTPGGSGAASAILGSFDDCVDCPDGGRELEAFLLLQGVEAALGVEVAQRCARRLAGVAGARLAARVREYPLCEVGVPAGGWDLREQLRGAGRPEEGAEVAELWRVLSALHVEHGTDDPAEPFRSGFFRRFRAHFEAGSAEAADPDHFEWVLRYCTAVMGNHWGLFKHLVPTTHPEHRFESAFFGALLRALAQRLAAAVEERGAGYAVGHLDSILTFEAGLGAIPAVPRGQGLCALALTGRVLEAWVDAEREHFNAVLHGCLDDPAVMWGFHCPVELLRYDEHKAGRGVVQLVLALQQLVGRMEAAQLSTASVEAFVSAVLKPCLMRTVETVGGTPVPYELAPPPSECDLAHPLLTRVVALNTMRYLRHTLDDWAVRPIFCGDDAGGSSGGGGGDASWDAQSADVRSACARTEDLLISAIARYAFDPAADAAFAALLRCRAQGPGARRAAEERVRAVAAYAGCFCAAASVPAEVVRRARVRLDQAEKEEESEGVVAGAVAAAAAAAAAAGGGESVGGAGAVSEEAARGGRDGGGAHSGPRERKRDKVARFVGNALGNTLAGAQRMGTNIARQAQAAGGGGGSGGEY